MAKRGMSEGRFGQGRTNSRHVRPVLCFLPAARPAGDKFLGASSARLRAMGAMLSNAFIPPDSILGCDEDGCMAPFSSGDWAWGLVQVLSLMMVYAYILFTASNMLSDGSELLLLVPSIAGIVGSVVLPILGAVPDGAILGGKSGHTAPHA